MAHQTRFFRGSILAVAMICFAIGSVPGGVNGPAQRGEMPPPEGDMMLNVVPIPRVHNRDQSDKPMPIPQATIDKLKSEFQVNTDAEVIAKIKNLSRNIQLAINILRRGDKGKPAEKRVGARLQQMFNRGALCLDLNFMPAQAACVPESGDRLNINKSFFVLGLFPGGLHASNLICGRPSAHDTNVLTLTNLLLHEGQHLLQDPVGPQMAGESDDHYEARGRHLTTCAEIEAENEEEEFLIDLKGALQHLESTGEVRRESSAPVRTIAWSVKRNSPDISALEVNIAELCSRIGLLRMENATRIANESAEKEITQTFLDSAGTPADGNAMRTAIAELVHPSTGSGSGSDSRKALNYSISPGTGEFTQSDGETTETLDTGLLDIYSMQLYNASYDIPHMYLTGPYNSATGEGALVGFLDVDNDGFFEPETGSPLIVSPVFNDPGDLAVSPSNGSTYFYNAISCGLHWLRDLDGDELPDAMSDAGGFEEVPGLIQSVVVSDNGKRLFGLPWGDQVADLRDDEHRVYATARVTTPYGHFFEPEGTFTLHDSSLWVPYFVDLPLEGMTEFEVNATPGAAVEVWSVGEDETPLSLLGSTITDPIGRGTVKLVGPVIVGDLVQARDVTHSMHSLMHIAGSAAGPGAVPPTLLLDKDGDGIEVSWAASCQGEVEDYAIFEGTLGHFTSHTPNNCADEGFDRTETIFADEGDRYFLVVPLLIGYEGSYGTDSAGDQRPASEIPCEPSQIVGTCPV